MAARLHDGLFIGESHLALDMDFIVINKVTRIISCSSNVDVLNSSRNWNWEQLGVKYLRFSCLRENPNRLWKTITKAVEYADEIRQFISRSENLGEGVLLHANPGEDLELCVVVALIYFMNSFCWSLKKAKEFMLLKVPFVNIRAEYESQLYQLECALHRRLLANSSKPETELELEQQLRFQACSWSRIGKSTEQKYLKFVYNPEQEQVLRNTYINSTLFDKGSEVNCLVSPRSPISHTPYRYGQKKTLRWVDSPSEVAKGKPFILSPFSKTPLPERPAGPSYNSFVSNNYSHSEEISRTEQKRIPLRSILRGGIQWLLDRDEELMKDQNIESKCENVFTRSLTKIHSSPLPLKASISMRPQTSHSVNRQRRRTKSHNQNDISVDDLELGKLAIRGDCFTLEHARARLRRKDMVQRSDLTDTTRSQKLESYAERSRLVDNRKVKLGSKNRLKNKKSLRTNALVNKKCTASDRAPFSNNNNSQYKLKIQRLKNEDRVIARKNRTLKTVKTKKIIVKNTKTKKVANNWEILLENKIKTKKSLRKSIATNKR